MNNRITVDFSWGWIALVLTIVFVVLKLTGVIAWSWWLVFLPMIITVGIGFIVVLAILILLFIGFGANSGNSVRKR